MFYGDLRVKGRISAIFAAALILVLAVFISPLQAAEVSGGDLLRISVLAIGKADCIVIRQGGRTMLIDTGKAVNSQYILSRLNEMEISKIDCLLITHFDEDHAGGAYDIISSLPVEKVFQPDEKEKSVQYDNYNIALRESGIKPKILEHNTRFELGGMKIELYPPKKSIGMVPNDYSVICSIGFGEKRFLFTGDATDRRMEDFTDANTLRYDFIKVPHHGMIRTASKPFMKLLRQSRPEYAVITDSVRDDCRAAVIMLLEIYRVKTFMTGRGDVLIASDGHKIDISD